MPVRARILLLTGGLAVGAASVGAWWLGQQPLTPGPSEEAAVVSPPEPTSGGGESRPLPPPSVSAVLAEPQPERRRQLVEALARLPEGQALLAETYARSNDGATKEQALVAAARLGEPEAVSWLAEVAATDEQLGARAAVALGSVEDRRAAAALAAVATGDGPTHVRANAARALAQAGGSSQASLLLGLVRDYGQPLRVRQEAALALARVGTAAVVPELLAVLEQLSSRDELEARQLRIALIQALGGIGSPQARAGLARHAARPLDATERAFLQQVLGG